jgi:hypothetical protein
MVPADALLLVAAALVVAAVWMRDRTPSGLVLTLSIVAYPLIIVGIPAVAFSLVDAYMVEIARVPPGEPMFLDEHAYPLSDALLDIGRGIGLLFLGFFSRDYARRKRLATRN